MDCSESLNENAVTWPCLHVLPPVRRRAARHTIVRCLSDGAYSIYLTEPFSDHSLASTLVDYTTEHADTISMTHLLGDGSSIELQASNSVPPQSNDPQCADWHQNCLRVALFLVSFTVYGLALSFGQTLAQDLTQKWPSARPSSIVWIGSCQLSMMYATTLLAQSVLQSRSCNHLHFVVGTLAALLTCLSPVYTNVIQGIVLQGVCQGVALGLVLNLTIYRVLSAKNDCTTALGTSVGAPIGGALMPPLLAALSHSTNPQFTMLTIGLWMLILTTVTGIFLAKLENYTLQPVVRPQPSGQPSTHPRRNMRTRNQLRKGTFGLSSVSLRKSILLTSLGLTFFALHTPPLLLPSWAQSSLNMSNTTSSFLLTTYFAANTVARLITARAKSSRHSPSAYIIIFSLFCCGTHFSWIFVRFKATVFCVTAAMGFMAGLWAGVYTSAVVEVLGVEETVRLQPWMIVAAAGPICIGGPVAGWSMHPGVGDRGNLGLAVIGTICFGTSAAGFWLVKRGKKDGHRASRMT